MSINDLTFGEIKELFYMFSNTVGGNLVQKEIKENPVIGKYCIARCDSAGVHAGEVVSVDGENVILKNARRLWSWKAVDGVALSGVAQSGIQKGCKIDSMNPIIYLTGVCELIPCTDKSMESINEK